MHLLVTRPLAETRPLRERLEAAGHTVSVEPLLTVELLPLASVAEGVTSSRGRSRRVQALILTSRNGVRALAGLPEVAGMLALPLFAVGPGTASAARKAGFTTVTTGPASARELAQVVAAACDPAAGGLMYVTGVTVAYDLEADLGRRGFEVHRHVVYRSRPRDSLSPATVEALRSGDIEGVLLMSPSTAEAYVRLVLAHGLGSVVGNIVHFCLSANVAARLSPLEPTRKVIAIQPNMEEMLALVATVAAQLKSSS